MIVSFGPEQLLALLLSAILPALVALATKRLASPGLKALALLFLAAVTGFVAELADAVSAGSSFDWRAALFIWLSSFMVAVLSHYGLLKPTGVTGSSGVIARKVPGGIGHVEPSRAGT